MSITLTVYNLSVKLETTDFVTQRNIDKFLDKFYTQKQKSFSGKGEDVKVFVSKIKNTGIYYLHTTQFVHLYQYMKEINFPLVIEEKLDNRDYFIHTCNFKVREKWKLRDNQIPVYDFLVTEPSRSKLIPLVMGSGKTLVSLMAIANINKRIGIVILSFLIEKWVSDITEVHEASGKDIMVIQGAKALSSVIQMAKDNNLPNNYIIFSHKTVQEYITAYEEDPESVVEMYGCAPIDLFPLLNIGVMLVDETHMAFHSLFKVLIHTNVEYQIGLSGTLTSDEPIVRRMHKVIYPGKSIYGDSMIQKYIDIYPIAYPISDKFLRIIKTTNYGSNNYSHIAFEKSILKYSYVKDSYFKLIHRTIEDYYISHYQDKDKLLIFVSTIDLATQLTLRLQDLYPDKIVNRYCEEDPYDNLLTSDIIVSTNLSAGTGVDIPYLRVCIQTVCISSTVTNLQSLGRLRKLPDRDVKFCYIYSNNISKHKQYHIKRIETFKEMAATMSYRQSRLGLH